MRQATERISSNAMGCQRPVTDAIIWAPTITIEKLVATLRAISSGGFLRLKRPMIDQPGTVRPKTRPITYLSGPTAPRSAVTRAAMSKSNSALEISTREPRIHCEFTT